MPMKSKAQRKWMHANKPAMAEEFESKTKKGVKLPERVKKKKVDENKKIRAPKRDRVRNY